MKQCQVVIREKPEVREREKVVEVTEGSSELEVSCHFVVCSPKTGNIT